MNARDFMKSYEQRVKNAEGGNVSMKELFNPEEKDNNGMGSMNFFDNSTNDNKVESSAESSAKSNVDSALAKESLEKELLQQEVNFSKEGIVNSAAEELELPDNVDTTTLEDEDGDSSIVKFPTPKGRTMEEFEAKCEAQRKRDKEKNLDEITKQFSNRFSKDNSGTTAVTHKPSGRTRSEFDRQCECQRQLMAELL